jgi:anti-sigma B factor antagonist
MAAAEPGVAMSLLEPVPFEMSVRAGSDAVVLYLSGEFDLSEVEAFRLCVEGAIASCDGAVVVDLADVTFMDSTGIKALLTARRCLGDEGREMRFQHLSGPVARILDLAGLSDLLGDTTDTGSEPAAAD